MNSEIAFTCKSGARAVFEAAEDENGPFATVVWLGKPTEADIEEFNQYAASQTGMAVDSNLLGEITKDQLPHAKEIASARAKRGQE